MQTTMSEGDTSLRLSADRTEIQPMSLNHTHVTAAVNRSQDSGSSLQFSKLNISDVGAEAAEELAAIGRREPDDHGIVQRLAFDHNRLTALPMEFALLSCLRYLNLKHNNFSVFPDVLTVMPSLDTLDISYNKIKRFPSQPGQLIQLRVLSISRNKLSRLPTYLSQFHNLEVLHLDKNPIEWPPKTVLEIYNPVDTSSMKTWIHNLQAYVESGTKAPENVHFVSNGKAAYLSERHNEWRFPLRGSDSEIDAIPHSRTVSMDSTASSIPDSLQAVAISKSTRGAADKPPPLRLGMLQPMRGSSSSPASFDAAFSSPADSDVFEVEGMSTRGYVAALHSRTISETSHSASFGRKTSMQLKESLHHSVESQSFDVDINFLQTGSELPENDSYSTSREYEDKGSDNSSPHFIYQDGPFITAPRTNQNFTQHAYTSSIGNLPSMSFERNSYFRRLSSFPAIALPKPMSSLMESARTTLFVLCQVYNAIEHFAILAIDERLASVLRKVLDPANADMLRLIRALDRFDTTSRKVVPTANICRDVVESCRDAVAAFIRALGVLTLQLQVISASDDVRYTRWITLELHGAIAEISHSWQTMLPQIDSIKLLLQTTRFQAVGDPPVDVHNHSAGVDDFARDLETTTRPVLRMRTTTDSRSHVAAYVGRTRTTRRHAGSFSSKDVEIGKKLPSYEEVNSTPPITSPSSRLPKRVLATLVSSSHPTPVGYSSTSDIIDKSHSRNASHSSVNPFSNYSPFIPLNPTGVDLSKPINQVDKETLQAIASAVEVAPSTWDMIENALGGSINGSRNEIVQHLKLARTITKKLSDRVHAGAADSDAWVDRKSLHDDARSFLKIVVQLSNIVKIHVNEHEISSMLRSNMEKLTNSTEEFAILLHVSSFTPTFTRPQSPIYHSQLISEDVLGSSLSRLHRNTHASSSGTLSFPLEGPRSALPTQSFKIPTTIRRLRSAREARVHPGDPG